MPAQVTLVIESDKHGAGEQGGSDTVTEPEQTAPLAANDPVRVTWGVPQDTAKVPLIVLRPGFMTTFVGKTDSPVVVTVNVPV